MTTNDRSDECEENRKTAGLPAEWARTERHPCFPDGNLGTFETVQGTCFYDRDRPGRYIIGHALELGDYTAHNVRTE